MFKVRQAAIALSIALGLSAGSADAALQRMGSVSNAPTIGGYPTWFQDKTGLALEFCDPQNQAELNGGWCTLIPPSPAIAPESFPNNFFIEHFYSDATAVMGGGTTKARLMIAMEASFANGAVVLPGDQMVFGRLRVFITNVPSSGTYTVYHPFGKWTFNNVAAGDRIFFTQDVGLACPGTFECALGTQIGPFLLPSPTPGGQEVPPIPDLVAGQDPWYDILVNAGATTPYPGTGKKYIADPARIGPITGGYCVVDGVNCVIDPNTGKPAYVVNDGTLRDPNIFRIEGPNGYVLEETKFSLNGRLKTDAIPGDVTVERASYTADATGTLLHVDAFAKAFETVQPRLPAQPTPPAVTPILSFYPAPCGGAITVNADGSITVNPPPYTAPLGATQYSMAQSGTHFWGQAQPGSITPYAYACVEDATARNAAGQIVPAFYLKRVTDDVVISTATFNGPSNGTLTVSATSTDASATLSLMEYGPNGTPLPLTNGTATVSSLLAAPAKIQIVSTGGGSTEGTVIALPGVSQLFNSPVAVNDTVTMFEDCSATPASGCATPQVIDSLANDTVSIGGTITPIRSSGISYTVAITQAPRLGTAVINADQTISYTPNANVNGTDSIAYTVTLNGTVKSNAASITINITPVNDAPIAVNDTTGAVVSRVNSVNVIANDTDPDGNADVIDAFIATWPAQLGAKPAPVNGVITYTPTGTGTFSFTYQAKDKAGVLSANTATVTVTVAGSEAISIAKAIYKQGFQGGANSARWTVSGTDSVKEGETLSIVYNNGTLTAAQGGGSCNGTTANPKCV